MSHHLLKDIYSTKIYSVAPDSSIIDALWLMRNERISCLSVILNDTPIGILTERDILRATDKILAGRKLEVRDLMTQPILTIEKDATPGDALAMMRENKIRHLVVSDDGFTILGMLTLTDILKKSAENCFSERTTVAKVMAHDVQTVKRGTSVMRVLHEMAGSDLSCIIIEENDEPQGIITERDLVWLLTEKPELWSMPVDDIMSIPVATTSAEVSPREAVDSMDNNDIRHLVVIDDNKKIIGLLTQSLLCRELTCPPSAS